MPDPATVRSTLATNHRVTAICSACGHRALLDLAGLDRRGLADRALLDLPLRCRCGPTDYTVTVDGAASRGR